MPILNQDNEEEFSKSVKKEFLQEAGDVVQRCDKLFQQLQTDPESSEIIQRIFRSIHIIQGAGMAAGFQDLAQFACLIEKVLHKVKEGQTSLSHPIIKILHLSNDKLREIIVELSKDTTIKIDYSELRSQLESIPEDNSTSSNKTPTLESEGLKDLSSSLEQLSSACLTLSQSLPELKKIQHCLQIVENFHQQVSKQIDSHKEKK